MEVDLKIFINCIKQSAFKLFFAFLGIVLLVTNIIVLGMFLKWINRFQFHCSGVADLSSYIAVQSHQNSLLQTYLVVFSLGIALFSFLGYHEVKNRIVQRAEEIIKAKVDEELRQPIADAKKAKDDFEFAKEVFQSTNNTKENVNEARELTPDDFKPEII